MSFHKKLSGVHQGKQMQESSAFKGQDLRGEAWFQNHYVLSSLPQILKSVVLLSFL